MLANMLCSMTRFACLRSDFDMLALLPILLSIDVYIHVQGDGEKPSRHEHEGPLLILSMYC